jgi:hypothetical protein
MTPESQNNGVRTVLSIAGQWLRKHFTAAVKIHTKRGELLRHFFLFSLTESYTVSTNGTVRL